MAVAACCILLLLLHSHNHRFDKAHHVGPKAMNRTASICRGHRYFCSDLISLSNLEYIIASVSLLLQLCLAWLKPYMGRWNSRPSDSELFIHTVYTCLYYQRMPPLSCIKHPGPLPKARNTTVPGGNLEAQFPNHMSIRPSGAGAAFIASTSCRIRAACSIACGRWGRSDVQPFLIMPLNDQSVKCVAVDHFHDSVLADVPFCSRKVNKWFRERGWSGMRWPYSSPKRDWRAPWCRLHVKMYEVWNAPSLSEVISGTKSLSFCIKWALVWAADMSGHLLDLHFQLPLASAQNSSIYGTVAVQRDVLPSAERSIP